MSTQATESEKNQDRQASDDGGFGVDADIKNLLSVVKLAKSNKPNFITAKSWTDFLTPGAKKAFIHLQKAFIKALILRHFDLEFHIQIETDTSRYAIGEILSQITSDYSDQFSSNYMTHKNLNPISFKSEIC